MSDFFTLCVTIGYLSPRSRKHPNWFGISFMVAFMTKKKEQRMKINKQQQQQKRYSYAKCKL